MSTITEHTGTEKSIRNVYLVAFALLLVSYLITLFSNRQLVWQAERVDNTNNVIKNLDDLLGKVKDAEMGVRGYIMTKDIQLLYPYYGSKEKAYTYYSRAISLTKDNPMQQQRLQQLKKNIEQHFVQLRFLITSFNNNRERTDSFENQHPKALKVMDDIRISVATIELEEVRQLKESEDKMKGLFKAVKIITIISLILAFSLLFFGFISYMQVSRARKKAQEELENNQEQLRNQINQLDKANTELLNMRSQEKFAATGRIARTIAHEVRNPLTNINLAAEQLKDEGIQKDEDTDYLFEMISRNSSRINQLISDLLNSTKISELNYEKISAKDLLNEALEEAKDRIALNNVIVIKNYSEDPCYVTVDKSKMKIAFLNIIINALEAMTDKEEKVLSAGIKNENEKCIITISDNGSGMDSETVTRLFEPYFTSKSNGTGLGLTNTQNIILNHKGQISLETVPGEGTSFIITVDLYHDF